MTLTVLVTAALMILMGLTRRRRTRRPERYSIIYWWTFFGFGFESIGGVLVATGLVDFDNLAFGLVLLVPSTFISLAIFCTAVRRNGKISIAGVLCIAPVIVSLGFVVGGGSPLTSLLSIITYSAVLIRPSIPYRLDDIMAGLASAFRLLCALLLVLAAVGAPDLIGPCRMDKCSIWGEQIGTPGTANGFGVVIAVLGVALLLRISWWRVLLVAGGSALLVDLTSSRSALLILGLGTAAVVVERLARARLRSALRFLVLLAGVASVATIAIPRWSSDDFTGRAKLWSHAKDLIAQRPLLGWGPSFWVRQPASTLVDPNYATHNVLLELLVSFGILGTLVIGAGILWTRLSIRQELVPLWQILIVAWLAGGAIEVLAAPGRSYLLESILLLIVLLGGVAARPVGDESPRLGLTHYRSESSTSELQQQA